MLNNNLNSRVVKKFFYNYFSIYIIFFFKLVIYVFVILYIYIFYFKY